MEKLLSALSSLPNPQAAWMAIEAELLNNNQIRELGEIESLGGAILQVIPELSRESQIENIHQTAIAAWEFFQTYGDIATFNEQRLKIRSAIMGHLNSPKFA